MEEENKLLQQVLERLDKIDVKLDKILKDVEYTDEHALRDYLLNVYGDITGDLFMNLLTGKQ